MVKTRVIRTEDEIVSTLLEILVVSMLFMSL